MDPPRLPICLTHCSLRSARRESCLCQSVHICLHCVRVHTYACTCVRLCLQVCSPVCMCGINIPACASIFLCTTLVLIIGVVWCLHGIHTALYLLLPVSEGKGKYNTLCILCLCLHGIHTVFCISPTLKWGEPGFEALSLLCKSNDQFLCKIEIPLFCTVYSKECTANVHLFHNLHNSTLRPHSFLLFFR